MKIKTKLALAISLLFALLIAIFAYFSRSYFEATLRQEIFRQQFDMLTAAAEDLDNRLAASQAMLTAAAGSLPTTIAGDADRLQAWLDGRPELHKVFENHVFVFSPTGRLVAESPFLPDRRGRDYSYRDYYRQTVADGRPYISDPFISSQAHQHPVIMMTAPVVDAEGKPVAILAGSMDLLRDNFLGKLARQRQGETGYFYLFTDQRRLIMHPDAKRIFTELAPGRNQMFDQAIAGFEGTGETINSYGRPMFVSFKRLSHKPWILAVNYPKEEALAPLTRFDSVFVAATLLGMALTALLGWLLMRRLLAPLTAFTDHLARLPEKKGAERLATVAGGSEITGMTRNFNDLIATLDQQQEALERDIAIQRRHEERLRLAGTVFEAAREAILVTDAEGIIVAVNPAFTAVTGYPETEAIGQTPRLLRSDRHPADFYTGLWQALLRDGYWQGEFWNRRRNGEIYPALSNISAVRDDAGQITHYVGIQTDISLLKEAESRVAHLAYHDPLTGLVNRRSLEDRADLALALAHRRHEPAALLFLDLDRFKEVNDSLGHGAGDAVLVQAADRIVGATRQSDTVARLGGDEFVMLLPSEGRDGVLQVADRVLAAVRQPFTVEGHQISLSTSIGIALYPHDGNNFGDLLKNADTALYRAKQEGRNVAVFYDREMNVATFERLLLETELRKAIAGGQLVTHYQPKLRLADGTPIGAEALVRWQHPEQGLVPPGRFIPVAEQSGLINDLGDWVLADVCRQLEAWQADGLPLLKVAVNLAARHFRAPGLPERVKGLLETHGLPASALELELTESTLLDAGEQVLANLQALKNLGIGLAIDDFGTGYSSLAYLKRMPITVLKIDQGFVRDLENDADDRILSSSIVALGHSMGLQVVAEGIETEEQYRILLQQGCDYGQGYLFARPLPVAEFTAWWQRQGH